MGLYTDRLKHPGDCVKGFEKMAQAVCAGNLAFQMNVVLYAVLQHCCAETICHKGGQVRGSDDGEQMKQLFLFRIQKKKKVLKGNY